MSFTDSTDNCGKTYAGKNTYIQIIYQQGGGQKADDGRELIKEFLMDDFNGEELMPEDHYSQVGYQGSSGTGEPQEGNPRGLALVQVRYLRRSYDDIGS